MKAAVVSGELGNDNPSIYSIDIAEGLLRKGHSVRFICAGARDDHILDDLGKEYITSGKLKIMDMPGLNTPFLSYYRRFELRQSCKNYRPDIIHATSISAVAIAKSLSISLKVPYVVTCHNYNSSMPIKTDAYFAKLIAISESLRVHMVNTCGHPKDRIAVIPNAINLRKYDAIFSTQQGKVPVIGGIGKLLPRKGYSYLLQAGEILKKWGITSHILIVGEGPQEKSLRQLARSLQIEEMVTFSKYPFKAHSVIKEMDIFVQSAIKESLGFSALEAMAYGKPVVAFGVGGVYSFMKDGETGILVNNKDVEALAEAIKTLVEQPERRTLFGRAGRRVIEEKYSLSVVSEKLLQLYNSVIVDFRGKNA